MIKFFSFFVLRSISGAFIFKKIEYSKTEETIQKKIENVKLIMYVLLIQAIDTISWTIISL